MTRITGNQTRWKRWGFIFLLTAVEEVKNPELVLLNRLNKFMKNEKGKRY